RIAHQCNPKPNLRERHRADVKEFQGLFSDKAQYVRVRFLAPQLGQDVRVEQPARHRSTSRTRMRDREGSMLVDGCGECFIASTSACPVRSPASRRKSSAPITTTSSRP